MYELTVFKNRFDNKTHKTIQLSDWNKFVKFLKALSETPRAGKSDAHLISPAIYKEGTTRSNKNVSYWGKWAAVDIDEFTGDIHELFNRFHRYNFCAYSTASSTEQNPKFRIVFDLNRSVQEDEVRPFWFALNTFLDELGDPQTKDSSRMYYIPAKYDNAFNFFECNYGDDVLDVDYLKARYPYKEREGNSFLDRLPADLQAAVVAHRKSTMNNTNITWTSYRDCPFFPKRLALEYKTISGTGWYHKMYQIMVATCGAAIKRGYPITAKEVADLCRELDNETGNWYNSRPLEKEADRAVEYAYRNN
jgi:hypothetical protein